jgi:hypothetical protein
MLCSLYRACTRCSLRATSAKGVKKNEIHELQINQSFQVRLILAVPLIEAGFFSALLVARLLAGSKN